MRPQRRAVPGAVASAAAFMALGLTAPSVRAASPLLAVPQDPPAAEAAPTAGAWRLRTIHGEAWDGVPSVEDGVVTVKSEDGETHQVDLAEVQDLVRAGKGPARPKTYPWGGRVFLRSGVDFPVEGKVSVPDGGDGKTVLLDSPVLEGQARYSLSLLRALRFPRDKAADDTRFQAALAAPHATDDYLFAFDAKNEMQRLPVKVQRVTADGVVMEFGGQERPPLAFAKVYGIVFAELSGAAADPLPAPLARVVLHSGDVLAGQVVQLDGRALTLQTDESIPLVTPTSGIARMEFVTDKLVYLSAMEPAKVEQVPAFDRTWPWLVDRAPSGPTIVLAGSEYNRGLVLFPRTRLEYDVSGKFDHFEATVGIEDRAGPQAHAIFRVLADGKEIYTSEPLTVGADPQVLKLPIDGVARVAIEADFGKNFDLGDHCVFAEARVTQK